MQTIIEALTNQKEFKKAQSYWTTLKNRLKKEGNETVTNCHQLKLLSADGEKYFTDFAYSKKSLKFLFVKMLLMI